jgi:hypothetical protein
VSSSEVLVKVLGIWGGPSVVTWVEGFMDEYPPELDDSE